MVNPGLNSGQTTTEDVCASLRANLMMGLGRSSSDLPLLPLALRELSKKRLSTESDFLDRFSAMEMYQFAGSSPLEIEAEKLDLAASETRPRISNRANRILDEIMQLKQPAGIWRAALTFISESGKRLPEERLPELLNWMSAHVEDAIPFVLIAGQRGLWLAKLNPAWHEVSLLFSFHDFLPEDATIFWETGNVSERKLLLQVFRFKGKQNQAYLAASQMMLHNTWKAESTSDRVTFLNVFRTGLTLADEQILMTALADGSREVRKAAVGLLSKLTGCQWEKRIADQAFRLVSYQHGTLLQKSSLDIKLPGEFRDDMTRDGIMQTPPGNVSLTAEAWWALQILSFTNPDRWVDVFKRTPDQLIAMATHSDWKGLFFTAWIQAAQNFGCEDWAEALLRLHPGERELLSVLSPKRAENFIQSRLRASFVDGFALLVNYSHGWSRSLTDLFISRFDVFLESEAAAALIGQQAEKLTGLAVRMCTTGLAGFENLLDKAAKIHSRGRNVVSEILAILTIRKNLEEELENG